MIGTCAGGLRRRGRPLIRQLLGVAQPGMVDGQKDVVVQGLKLVSGMLLRVGPRSFVNLRSPANEARCPSKGREGDHSARCETTIISDLYAQSRGALVLPPESCPIP